MAPWLIVVLFVVVVAGTGWLVDQRARHRRRGLERMSGPRAPRDRIADVERADPGTVQRVTETVHVDRNF
jgi:hypothetical protein